MSVFSLGLVDAEAVQRSINQTFPIFEGEGQFTFVPLLNYLTDPMNTNGVLQTTVSPGGAKKRIAKTVYQPRNREADVSTSVAFSCTSSNEAGQLSSTCEIDETSGVKISEKIDRVALGDINMATDEYISRRILALMDVSLRKMETEAHTKLAAAIGKFPDDDTSPYGGTTQKVVNTLKPSSTDTALNAIEEIQDTRQIVGLPRMFTMGQNLITKYFSRLDSGCCSDSYAADLGEFAAKTGVAHIHSNRVEAALGSTEFFGLFPGAAHIVQWNRFAGPNRIEDNSYKQMTLSSPVFPNVPFDVTMKEDCGDLFIEIGLAWELCSAPTDYFAIDDRLDGFNGILNFKVTNT